MAPAPVTWGKIPFHFSMALRFASIFLSSIRSGEIFIFCNRSTSASAVAAAMVCSASTFILSRSLFAFNAFCSAVCFVSIASVKRQGKTKLDDRKGINGYARNKQSRSMGFLQFRAYCRSFGNQYFHYLLNGRVDNTLLKFHTNGLIDQISFIGYNEIIECNR